MRRYQKPLAPISSNFNESRYQAPINPDHWKVRDRPASLRDIQKQLSRLHTKELKLLRRLKTNGRPTWVAERVAILQRKIDKLETEQRFLRGESQRTGATTSPVNARLSPHGAWIHADSGAGTPA